MFEETHEAFKLSLDEYIYFGGYPGSLPLIKEEERWKSYIKNSLIETTISRDVMLLTRIDKPALLRQLFFLSCEYSGQILSYQKMVGQLQDAGNTTTLAHYLELLAAVGFIKGLQKFTGSKVLTRSSSPKLQVYNTALLSALSDESFKTVRLAPEKWGRWVESAVGAHLLNKAMGTNYKIEYWKEGPYEVDFVLSLGKKVVALEVKSGKKKESLPGLAEIRKKYDIHRGLVIGPQGISLHDFFKMNLEDFFTV
ncbi:MAG: ATP-binding protein [Pseudobdellovibrionaceae bacterium]